MGGGVSKDQVFPVGEKKKGTAQKQEKSGMDGMGKEGKGEGQ